MLNNLVMKKYVFLLGTLVSLTTFAQSDSLTLHFEKLINHAVKIPFVFYNDSCFLTSTLLKIDIDNQAMTTDINFSDNAEDWLKESLPRIIEAIDKPKLKRYCIKTGIRKKSVIIPIIIESSLTRCLSKNDFHWRENYYDFKGKKLKGDCFFVEPVKLVLEVAVQ